MKKVFLGGTCNESTWRDIMMRYLDVEGLEYFNPIVEDWTSEHQAEEIKQRESCDFCLYTITPKMTGVYSIAEVIDDSNKRPKQTVLVLLKNDETYSFEPGIWKSLLAVAEMVRRNGGQTFDDLKYTATWMKGEK